MSTLKVGVDIGAAVITTPIACVLGVFSNLFIGRDTEGNITSTLPDDWQYDLSWLFYWNPDNPQEIDRNSSVEISVIGGFPPYTWSVSGNGFSLSLNETEGSSNALIADSTACGAATIEVIDNYGVPVTGYVRCTAGQWVDESVLCYVSTMTSTACYGIPLGQYRYQVLIVKPFVGEIACDQICCAEVLANKAAWGLGDNCDFACIDNYCKWRVNPEAAWDRGGPFKVTKQRWTCQ